jgi:tetratricopeptide (TPR) repeat protein
MGDLQLRHAAACRAVVASCGLLLLCGGSGRLGFPTSAPISNAQSSAAINPWQFHGRRSRIRCAATLGPHARSQGRAGPGHGPERTMRAMPSRETALKALLARVRRASEQENPAALLSHEARREAAELAALADPDQDLEVATLLGMFHWGRYLALPEGHDQADFDAAARFFQLVYQTMPQAVPELVREHYEQPGGRDADASAGGVSRRALGLMNEYNSTLEPSRLIEAITMFRAAVAAADGDPDRCRYLSNLGAALRMDAERTGNVSQLAEAAEIQRAAVACADGHAERGSILFNLCAALASWSEYSDDTGLLIEAVQAGREAVTATPAGDSDRASILSGLGAVLVQLARRTGDAGLMQEAVEAHRSAVAATADGHPYWRARLSNLGSALYGLFEWTGDTTLLVEAADSLRLAATAIRPGDPDRASLLSNLGSALTAMSEQTRDDGLLSEAIEVQRTAVAAAVREDPYRAMYLSNLGSALQLLSEWTADTAPLREAVRAHRGAVAALPRGHADRAGYLFNLGNALQALGQRTSDVGLLTEAAAVHRQGVAASPMDHPDGARGQFCLGSALEALAGYSPGSGLLVEARACYQRAADNPVAPAPDRIKAYYQVARVSGRAEAGRADALAAMEAAIELLPQIAPRTLARQDRSHRLGRLAGLAGAAAAAAVAAGQPGRAVELLEQTRGVLAAGTLQARSSDLGRLRVVRPALADEFERLRDRLDALDSPVAQNIPADRSTYPGHQSSGTTAWPPTRDWARERHVAQDEWDQLIGRIRATDGLDGFLKAPGIAELARQASGGPVVFIYTSPRRCGALALAQDPRAPVHVIDLGTLTEDNAREQVDRLAGARSASSDGPASRAAKQREIHSILAWMWDTITGPVLAELGYNATPGATDQWPRVWWCPVGLLAYLPLHAAGHHSDLTSGDPPFRSSPRTVLDRVVSSYTATLRELAYARTRPRSQAPLETQEQPTDPASPQATVIVAVPNAPGVPPLPGVSAEAQALATLIPGAKILPDPTRDHVLDALASHAVAHFACHGSADLANPAASQLILPDHETAPLTVADIAARRIIGDLAYLSACDTAVTSQELADEAVHISGACHLAGYQHVIGTLWPVMDQTATELASAFYTCLTHSGTSPPNTRLAANALHHAIRNLRAQYPASPALWASHTHTGI